MWRGGATRKSDIGQSLTVCVVVVMDGWKFPWGEIVTI
jgi:hypothetical protein